MHLDASGEVRKPALVICVGNEFRGDDAVGSLVGRLVNELAGGAVAVTATTGEGAALMEEWESFDSVVVVDAVSSGAEPGTIYRLDANEAPVPVRFFNYSTHAFSVAEAIELGRVLGSLPPRLVVFGIEGETFEAGLGISPRVARAAENVSLMILEECGIDAGRAHKAYVEMSDHRVPVAGTRTAAASRASRGRSLAGRSS